MPYAVLPVHCWINPLSDGLTAGPRLPRLLISAMPQAAAALDRYSVIRAKKSGVAAAMPIVANDRARIDPTRFPCHSVVMNKPIAPIATHAAKRQRRS